MIKAQATDSVDEFSRDATGWARFSADRRYRYRLGRLLTPRAHERGWDTARIGIPVLRCVTFLMLNPSTADAFKLDPTVKRCAAFANRWGADILEVVNLFAFRSPRPVDLRADIKAGRDPVGPHNDAAIVSACTGADRVIAAWGSNGALEGRGSAVATMLGERGIALQCLARVPSDGSPMHPLARGKHRIPDDKEPSHWSW